jgi:transposase
MSSLLKYSLGIDLAKDKLDVCLVSLDAGQTIKVKAQRKFANTLSGFKELHQWIKKHLKEPIAFTALVEATGVYHEKLAVYLFDQGYHISMVLPNKAKHYMQVLGFKSKNDKADARGLACMGAQLRFAPWQPINSFYLELRQLTRHHQSLQQCRTIYLNQIHALAHGAYCSKAVARQLKKTLALIDKQIKEMRQAIHAHIESEPQVKQQVGYMSSIKGVQELTAATVLAETAGFALIDNISQLVSYAGYDVVENQSGKRVGKTRISKKGNSRLRRILYMPALNVVRYQQKPFADLYERVLERTKVKMKAYVAVQKKLLVLMYVLCKKKQVYRINEPEKVEAVEAVEKVEKKKEQIAKCSQPEPFFQVCRTAAINTASDIKKVAPTSRATQDEQPVSFAPVALFQVLQI